MQRRTFIKNAGMAGGMMAISPLLKGEQPSGEYGFPLVDLHVHITNTFTIDHAMALAEKRGVKLGIVEHPAVWAIKDDADLKKHIEKLRKYPVYIGLQPITTGWEKSFSPRAIAWSIVNVLVMCT